MQNSISNIVQQNVSEHIVDSSPLFLEFIQTYYRYADQRTKASGLIQNNHLDTDIDLTLDSYVSRFYDTYGQFLPKEIALDKRNFLKLLNTVYEAKGTENALKLIFRAIFNEYIEVTYPGNQILKASDGVWVKESFITVTILFGNISNQENDIIFSNSFGNYSIKTSRYEIISPTTIRLYYNNISKIKVDDNQIFFIKDLITNENIFVCRLEKSPSNIRIQQAGTNWQVGQVVVIPGTNKNTIARITAVDSVGGILNVEILEYGHTHFPTQTTYISPYPNKPLGSIIDIESTLVSINPNVYNHQINISDYTDGVTEEIIGTSYGGGGINSYFLQSYVSPDYNGFVNFVQKNSSGSVISAQDDTEITIDDWLKSRAIFVYEQDYIVGTKGYYKSEAGQLSNQSIKIQDNYYHQIFSYVIESSKNISEYKNILSTVHPAGLKMFSLIAKQANISTDISASRTKSYDTIFLIDILNQSQDTATIDFSKYVYDQVSNYEKVENNFTKLLTSSLTVADIITKNSIKYNTDSVLVESFNTYNTSTILLDSYDLQDYFAENYVKPSQQLTLSIGY